MNKRTNMRTPPRVHPLWAVAFFVLLLLAGTFLVRERLGRPPRSFPAVQPMAAAKPEYMTIIRESLREGVQLTGRSYESNSDSGGIYVCAEVKGQPTQTGKKQEQPTNAPVLWGVWHVKNPAAYIIQSAEAIAQNVSTLRTDDTPPETALKLQKAAETQSAQR